MNSKLKPAIIGGLVVGLLSAIPVVNFVNICCCLWAILGGLIASKIYINASPTPVKAGDGAVLGVLSGVVGAAIYIVIGIPIALILRGPINAMLLSLIERLNPAQVELMRQSMADQTIIGAVIRGLIFGIILIIFSVLGGLLGVPIFEKRKGNPAPPPPPQSYGGGTAA
ncbi:MAG: hypothetical protein JWM21_316 [Acidobacteria bacterium]|nr:hypothetical protein [Acidobacteriota bacterium]